MGQPAAEQGQGVQQLQAELQAAGQRLQAAEQQLQSAREEREVAREEIGDMAGQLAHVQARGAELPSYHP